MNTIPIANNRAKEIPSVIWNRAFIGVFAANASMNLAQQMMNSLVAKYTDYLGATPKIVGLVTSLFAFTALLFKIVSGPAIDSFNRRFILMGAMSVMAFAYFGYSVSKTISMMIYFRLIQGTGQAFTATCCLALAADTLPPDKLGSGIGVFSMAQAACQAIGPTIALFLVGAFGYKITFTIGSCLMVLAALAASQVKTFKRDRKVFRISLDNILSKEAIIPALIFFFLSMAFCVINSFLIIFADKQKVANIGLYFTVYAGTMLFTRPFIGKLTDKFGLVKILIPAMFCFAMSFILISFSGMLWMFLLAAFIAAFGYGACQPAIQTLSMKSVPSERRGAASSTNYIGNDLGNLVGPVIAGTVVEMFGYVAMWRIMLFPVGMALAVVLFYGERIKKIEESFIVKSNEGVST